MLPKGLFIPSGALPSEHETTTVTQIPDTLDHKAPGLCDFHMFKYDAKVQKGMKTLDPGLIVSTGEKATEHCFSVPVNPGCPRLASLNGSVRAQAIKQIAVLVETCQETRVF